MRRYAVKPALSMQGRKAKGLRGWAGKPLHPPLTDVPIAAYLLAAVFDVLSVILYSGQEEVASKLYHAATWVLLGGAVVSLGAALTGWADWRTTQRGTQVRRTVNTHATLMIVTTGLVLLDIVLRVGPLRNEESTPVALALLTVVAAVTVSLGASYGGSLVYDYGFNVETAGDHPAYHESETDVLPGKREPAAPAPRTPGEGGRAEHRPARRR